MKYVVLAIVLAGCFDPVDPEWQLDHDRIVAVRANPPHIPAGASATFDALIAHKGAPTDVEQPIGAVVYAPKDLSSAVVGATVTAPAGVDPNAPTPLDVLVEFPDSNGIHLVAKKTVYLGDSADNAASVGNVTVNGAPPDASIVIPIDVDVPLGIDADPSAAVMWLTSCGTMHDDDEHAAFIHVLPDDPKQGELVVVVRDTQGGVAWRVWPISAQ